jgi:hypothetical protein
MFVILRGFTAAGASPQRRRGSSLLGNEDALPGSLNKGAARGIDYRKNPGAGNLPSDYLMRRPSDSLIGVGGNLRLKGRGGV